MQCAAQRQSCAARQASVWSPGQGLLAVSWRRVREATVLASLDEALRTEIGLSVSKCGRVRLRTD
jgi:hypothetical protein